MPAKVDIKGCRFGSLVVIREDATRTSDGKVRWECRCDCGAIHVAAGRELRLGKTTRCRACRAERYSRTGADAVRATHGRCGTPEYTTRLNIIQRCTNPNNTHWESYGGRGIKVCQRWLDSFQAFYDDMGPRPSAEHSIERLDNDGDYCPENCIWATEDIQARNKRTNVRVNVNGKSMVLADAAAASGLPAQVAYDRRHQGWADNDLLKPIGSSQRGLRMITHNGRTRCVADWAKETGIPYSALMKRLGAGWSIADALTRPLSRLGGLEP